MCRCPFCTSVGKEMEYDCDFSVSEIKSFMCPRCGATFKAHSVGMTTMKREKR